MLLIAASAALGACSVNEPDADKAGTVLFSPLSSEAVAPEVVEDPDAPAANGVKEIQAIVSEFETGASNQPNFIDLESRFIERGRYLDLVGIYQNMLQKNTSQNQADMTPVKLRLVRAYLRLGQMHLAREALDELIAERADSPMTWFLNAAYWLPEAGTSEEAAARVIANWQKSLQLDADFVGFEQPDAPPLRAQLKLLRQRVSAEKIAEAVAELHKKMNPNAVAKDSETTDETVDEADNVAEVAKKELAPILIANPTPPAAAAQPEPAKPGESTPQRIPFIIAHANMALAQGKTDEAERLFKQALEREPTNFQARFGLIRAGWPDESRRAELANSVRKLAKRKDLTPRQQYEVGRFVFFDLDDRKLALSLWSKVKERDPELAEMVGLDALIDDVIAD
jgi:tetratricopeptide (TPR) repeat protein